MSYESENYLRETASTKDVLQFIELIGYIRIIRPQLREENEIAQYYFFDEVDYRSWSGIGLSVYQIDGKMIIYTRTSAARSYFDLAHQNYTIQSLKKFFGGTFATGEGKGRYLSHHRFSPPTPPQSGCHLAYQRFGSNLLRASLYIESRNFPKDQWGKAGVLDYIDQMNPRLLSNNLLLPFLTSILEDYFKSTYIALLRYSDKKETVIKNARPSTESLAKVASNEITMEEAIAESLPFQRISSICQNYKNLDAKLDIAGVLKKPYRRRKTSLFESLEEFVLRRHKFIHRAEMDISFEDSDVQKMLDDLEEAITRCYKFVTDYYGWIFTKTWSRGKKRPTKRTADLAVRAASPAEAK